MANSINPDSISIVSLNIWCSQTLDRVLAKLAELQPDITLLQEVYSADLPQLTEVCGPLVDYVPLGKITQPNPWNLPQRGEWGLALFSKVTVAQRQSWPIAGQLQPVPAYLTSETSRTVALSGFKLAAPAWSSLWWLNTHFTWSPDGQASELQRQHALVLRNVLASLHPFVLMGDLNAPRGGEIFATISQDLTDHIPQDCLTTIDAKWHRNPSLRLLVDTALTTPGMRFAEVKLFDDVSDHWGIWARVLPPTV